MRSITAALILSIGLILQGCEGERIVTGRINPGTSRDFVEKTLGEPVKIVESNMGIVAVYKHAELLNRPFVPAGYFSRCPEKEDESSCLSLNVLYDIQDHVSSFVQGPHVDTLVKAANGDTEAQLELAARISRPVEKWRWLCRAAHFSKSSAAAYKFSKFHTEGTQGFEKDLTSGLAWLFLSASRFDVESHTASQTTYWRSRFPQIIEALRELMTPDQIAEAERRAEEWQPNPAECEIESRQSGN
ncbi:MAG: hypothetical protein MN733_33055 [Nitrososphaera sp.]|nr:hypothetical protein [Nitrososphaera sp.]